MVYLFEDFALDTGRRELRRADAPVVIEPKVFDLLAHLVANRDRVVGKDDLIAAVWDGRIVSDSALASAIAAARGALGDSGSAQRLIRTLPRKGVRFVGTVVEPPPAPPTPEVHRATSPTRPDKPSIAVLPFDNLSADPEQEYFSDGVAEEIITALSRMPLLFVIARSSSFTYKRRAADVQEVGRDLGVRYVLSGSVRRSGRRIRVTAQLADATSRASLWAESVDGTTDDLFALQDSVTRSVVGTVLPSLEEAEIARALSKPTGNLGAYDHYLRALPGVHAPTRESLTEAMASCRQAYDLDPTFGAAYGLAARCYMGRKSYGWWSGSAEEIAETLRLARRGAELGPTDPRALAWSGAAIALVGGDLPGGIALLEAALALDANHAFACWWRGWTHIWQGEPETGVSMIDRACRLSPVDPMMPNIRASMAHGHFFAGRPEEAISLALAALASRPTSHVALRILALAAASSGDLDRARDAVARLRQVDPNLRVSTLRSVVGPYPNDILARYEDGLRRAGLPE